MWVTPSLWTFPHCFNIILVESSFYISLLFQEQWKKNALQNILKGRMMFYFQDFVSTKSVLLTLEQISHQTITTIEFDVIRWHLLNMSILKIEMENPRRFLNLKELSSYWCSSRLRIFSSKIWECIKCYLRLFAFTSKRFLFVFYFALSFLWKIPYNC